MWQSKRIKHWLGSTSQNVIVNRKSELRGSISCGVSKTLCRPKQPPVLRVAKQKAGSWWPAWPKAWLRTHRHRATLGAKGQESPGVQRGELWIQPLPSAAAMGSLVLGQSRGRRRKSNEMFELQLSPIRSMLIKQETLPGCQSSSLAFQSVVEELLVQGWALPVLGEISVEKNLKCRREVTHGM